MGHLEVVQTTQNHDIFLEYNCQRHRMLHLPPGPLRILLNNGIPLVNKTILFLGLMIMIVPSLVGEFSIFKLRTVKVNFVLGPLHSVLVTSYSFGDNSLFKCGVF